MKRLPLLLALLALPICSLLAQASLPDPIAHYPFNSGFQDESGNNRNGTGEDVGFTNDSRGNALAAAYFNNQTSLVSALQVNSGQAEYTFSGLILPYSNQQYTTLLYIGTNSAANGIGIALKKVSSQDDGNNIVVFAGGRFESRDTTIKIEAFRWQHYVLVKRLDTVKMYVNGEKIFSQAIPNNPSTSPLYIGTSLSHRQAHRRSFNGVIDEVKFFGLALTDSQVVDLYTQDYSTISQSVGILKGNAYLDANRNCSQDTAESALMGRSVVINPGGLVVPLNAEGSFAVPVSSGTYRLSLQPVRFFQIDSICGPDSVSVQAGDSASVTLGIQGQACPVLNVSIGTMVRRRCFNTSSFITVQNLSTVSADSGARLVIEYPRLVRPTRFWNLAPTDSALMGDSSMRYSFALPAIGAGAVFRLRMTDSTFCRDSAMGQLVCTKAALTDRQLPCLARDTAWDGSDLVTAARCDPDSVGVLWLSVRNQGAGSMRRTAQATILANDGIVSQHIIQLAAGDSALFRAADNGEVWGISVPQAAGHPVGGSAISAWSGCFATRTGTGGGSLLATLNLGDESPMVDIDCMEIVDSWDPNDKLVTPSGVGPNRIVAPKTRLEYKIRFQNKGTASTYFVTIRDTLSADLDVLSFERGAESHPGAVVTTYKYGEQYIVQWRWASLVLTPESVNDAASQGFVTFRMSPREGLALGTDVANKAGIFFDYNRPVVTEPVRVRFDNLPVTTVPNPVVEPVSARKRLAAARMVLAPNPAQGSVHVAMNGASATGQIGYVLRDVIGREVGRGAVPAKGGAVSLTSLHKGIYLITLKAGTHTETHKFIVE